MRHSCGTGNWDVYGSIYWTMKEHRGMYVACMRDTCELCVSWLLVCYVDVCNGFRWQTDAGDKTGSHPSR